MQSENNDSNLGQNFILIKGLVGKALTGNLD